VLWGLGVVWFIGIPRTVKHLQTRARTYTPDAQRKGPRFFEFGIPWYFE
jgi:hypothetical protein